MDISTTTLTPDQEIASNEFFGFLLGDRPWMLISGDAGTGKSFLMSWLVNVVLDEYQSTCKMLGKKAVFDTVHFAATTNKAAESLERSLGRHVSTIHSLMRVIPWTDYKTGKTSLKKRNDWGVIREAIVFIDECSMLDNNTMDLINETFIDCKIVFVGDHAQLAPIGEDLSRCFLDLAPDDPAIFMGTPVRNAGQPALVALCKQLRRTVETGIFEPIQEVEGVVDFLSETEMQDGLEHYFTDRDPNCRVVCYTNAQVAAYNDFIREDVRGLPAELQAGDAMVVSKAFNSGKVSLSVEREVTLTSVSKETLWTQHQADFPQIPPLPYVTVRLANSPMDFMVPRDPALLRRIVSAYKRRKEFGTSAAINDSFLHLQEKSASTVYKAQGATHEAVFIDLSDIGTSFDPAQTARMLFVAASRAKERVFFYGALPGRYHNSNGKALWEPFQFFQTPLTESSPPSLKEAATA